MNAKNLGEFEILTLAALVRLGGDAYGARIRDEIETRANRPVAIGQMYATLSRIEKKRYVCSYMGEGTAERGGRAKKYYEIKPVGRRLLEKSLIGIARISDGIIQWPELKEKRQ